MTFFLRDRQQPFEETVRIESRLVFEFDQRLGRRHLQKRLRDLPAPSRPGSDQVLNSGRQRAGRAPGTASRLPPRAH